jgi:hypothetical protein
VSDGLGERLAECGLFPMFGMPTRVRALYHGLRGRGHSGSWATIDRDLDLAIFEFAPGRILVKDKKRYRTLGLSPAIMSKVGPTTSGAERMTTSMGTPRTSSPQSAVRPAVAGRSSPRVRSLKSPASAAHRLPKCPCGAAGRQQRS